MGTKTTPGVTVLMPVYNGERHLREAIDSMLGQTYSDFEFLIVDDGSSDGSAAIVRSYDDPRIRLITFPANKGLSAALNEGLRQARASLVARQDADDISEPGRLAREVDAFAANARLTIVGSQARAIDETGAITGLVQRPLSRHGMRWYSIFENPFIHTAVMFRKDAVLAAGGFDAQYDPFSQDYDLWSRILAKDEVANLAEPLVRYRVNSTSIIGALAQEGSAEYQARFARIATELSARQARRLLGETTLTEAEAPLLAGFALGLDRSEIPAALALFDRLLASYLERFGEADDELQGAVARQLDALAFRIRRGSRASAAAVYWHTLRCHPAAARHLSWPQVVAQLVVGTIGRNRLAALRRAGSAAWYRSDEPLQ